MNDYYGVMIIASTKKSNNKISFIVVIHPTTWYMQKSWTIQTDESAAHLSPRPEHLDEWMLIKKERIHN